MSSLRSTRGIVVDPPVYLAPNVCTAQRVIMTGAFHEDQSFRTDERVEHAL
jgi:hypothetical protein